MEPKQAFLLLGLVGIAYGIYAQFGPGWASVVTGSILFLFGLFGESAPPKGGAR